MRGRPAGRATSDVAFVTLEGAGQRASALRLEEERDAELCEGEIGDGHPGDDGEEGQGQGLEAKQTAQRADIGQGDPGDGAGQCGEEERRAWPALEEGDAAGADDEDN